MFLRFRYFELKKPLKNAHQFVFFLFVLFVVVSQTAIQAQVTRGTAGDLWADLVLGQIDFGQVTANQAVNSRVFSPTSVLVDNTGTTSRLYVYDQGNNRVLGFSDISSFASNTSSSTGGYGADMVLGQPDFAHTGANFDSTLQNYPIYPTPSAQSLCLQPPKEWSPGESTSNGNMAVDPQGNLYIPDFYNNRVLRYDKSSLVSGAANVTATYVWGQPNFSTNVPNGTPNWVDGNPVNAPTNHTFYWWWDIYDDPTMNCDAGVAIDGNGNLWVTDNYNYRVLRFPASSPGSVPSTIADVVLGQNSFTANVPASGLSDLTHMGSPEAVRVDSQGWVYVADMQKIGSTHYGRVLIYQPTSTSNGQYVYGTNNMGLVASTALTQYLAAPTGLEFDPATGGIWVTDTDADQVILYTHPAGSLVFTAKKVLLTDTPHTLHQCVPASSGDGPNFFDALGNQMNSWAFCGLLRGSVGIDNNGNVFLSGGNSSLQDILRFPAPIPTIPASPSGIAHSADMLVFKSNQITTGQANQLSSSKPNALRGLAVASAGGVTQILISDAYKLLYWNIPSGGVAGISSGTPATGNAGSNPTSILTGTYFGRITTDQAASYGSPNSHLWALATTNAGYDFQVRVYSLPLSQGDLGALVWDSINPLPLLSGGTLTLGIQNNPYFENGLAVTPDGQYLWLTDNSHNRVVRIRNPLTNPKVDIVLGQPNATNVSANQPLGTPSATNLNLPGSIKLDHNQNLYVADQSPESQGNTRELRYDAGTIQNLSSNTVLYGVPASGVFGTNGSFTSSVCSGIANDVCNPWDMAFNSDDSVMVVGMNGQDSSRYPSVLLNPRSADQPIAHLNDFSSQSFCAAFDDDNNLYMGDMNWGRVLVYLKPFTGSAYNTPTMTLTNTPSSPTPSPTNTPTFTPSSPTPSPTFTPTYPTFTWTNTPPATWTPTPTPSTCISCPTGLTFIPNSLLQIPVQVGVDSNYLYVPDEGPNTIRVFNLSTGSFSRSLTGSPYSFSLVSQIALDGQGHGFVTDINANRIVKLDATTGAGMAAITNGTLDGPYAVTMGDDGDLYVGDRETVRKFQEGPTNTFTQLAVMGTPGSSGKGSGNNQFNNPKGLVVAGGYVYVLDSGNLRVQRWNAPTGTNNYAYDATVYTMPGMNPLMMGGLTGERYVYVTYNGGVYDLLDTATTPWTLVQRCSNLTGAVNGVAVDGSGNLYFSSYGPNDVVKLPAPSFGCLTPTGTLLPTNTPTPVQGTQPPSATPNFTLTFTATYTGTSTPSWTTTATTTWTSTNSPIGTPTNSLTPTPTGTTTDTPTSSSTWTPGTATFTNSPTPSSTWSPTDTMTWTPTNSLISTPTPTQTPSYSPTVALSPTWTPTSTATLTTSFTSTFQPTATAACAKPVFYPNPYRGTDPLFIHFSPCDMGQPVRVRIFTVSFRKVVDWDLTPIAGMDKELKMVDNWNHPLANGFYYLVIDGPQGRTVHRLLVLR